MRFKAKFRLLILLAVGGLLGYLAAASDGKVDRVAQASVLSAGNAQQCKGAQPGGCCSQNIDAKTTLLAQIDSKLAAYTVSQHKTGDDKNHDILATFDDHSGQAKERAYTTSHHGGVLADPLPSWNDGVSKKAIVDFVLRVTNEESPDFVPVEARIATFDNDGTLWAEQPMYFQMAFALDRVKALPGEHPEWKEKQPFKSVLAGDMKALAAEGEKGLLEVIAATHAGMTTEEFEKIVKQWGTTAKHPRFNKPYVECIYRPMVELLEYLRANDFKTYIVSGGGIEFMRPWVEQAYGIPPEQVVGSSGKLKYELRDGKPVLLKLPEINFIDDKQGKPIGIHQFIGRRPILAFGNSDGDYEMLRWTTTGAGPRLGLILHHTDNKREWAYDRDSPFGRLSKALNEAPERGWVVVDMKKDWNKVFPFVQQ